MTPLSGVWPGPPDSTVDDLRPVACNSPRILIVADDLTGGNSCGALFAEAGLHTVTLASARCARSADLSKLLDVYDAVVVNAETRHLPPEAAAAITSEIVLAAGPVDVAACRIDTTLRGNIGSTVKAALESRRRLAPGRRVMGLCVPAFPSAGRTTVKGRQLLHGKLLEETELRNDVRSPMCTSVVVDILKANTDLEAHQIELGTVLDGAKALRTAVLRGIILGVDVIVCDAVTTEHVDLIAQAVVGVSRELSSAQGGSADENSRVCAGLRSGEGLEWLPVDPGPSSLAVARALLPESEDEVILGIVGSATEVTRAQLAKLAEDSSVAVLRAVLDEDNLPDVDATVEQVKSAAAASAIIVATAVDASDLHALTPQQSGLLPVRLAQIAAEVMATRPIYGLYTTGGDITAAVLAEVGALGMELDTEIVPLAVGGRLTGGPYSGVLMATKGGLIGEPGTAVLCIDYLKQTARLRNSFGCRGPDVGGRRDRGPIPPHPQDHVRA